MLTDWKKQEELDFLNEVSCVPLQQGLRHLQTAFTNFFAGRTKYPTFKKKLTPSQYTEILFHEMTHAWQFATGKLVIENYKVAKYGRQRYDLKEFEYFLQPWEIEAYGYQYCMNRLFWDI